MGFQRHKTTCFKLDLIQATHEKATPSQMHVQTEGNDVRGNKEK